MESVVLLYIVVTLMLSTGARGQSYSMSCSTVNGKQVCESQQNQGNMASSSSQAISGGANGDYQNAYAGAGSPDDWSSSQTQQGVAPPAGAFPGFGNFGFGGFGFPNFGAPTSGGGSSASQSASGSSGSSGNEGGNQQGTSSFSSSAGSGGSDNQGGYQTISGPGGFTYTSTNTNGGGSFAAAGGMAGAFAGPMAPAPMPFINPANFNPFAFVFGRR